MKSPVAVVVLCGLAILLCALPEKTLPRVSAQVPTCPSQYINCFDIGAGLCSGGCSEQLGYSGTNGVVNFTSFLGACACAGGGCYNWEIDFTYTRSYPCGNGEVVRVVAGMCCDSSRPCSGLPPRCPDGSTVYCDCSTGT